MLTALTFTAKSTSAASCTSLTRDVEVHGLVVRPITTTSRGCFQSGVARSLAKPNNLEINALKKSAEIRQIAKPNICSQTF